MGRNTSQVPLWNLPFRRNPFFTGREELLTRLHDQLNQSKTAALTQAQAISGMGGIGKTQTAVEYAYRYQEEYQVIFWVGAETRLSLLADFGKIATLVHLAEKDAQDQEALVTAVKHWLLTHPDWLLILDNADDVQMASDFLPPGGRGHILLTTRAQAAGSIARSLQVEEMDTQEGTLLLLRRAGALAMEVPVESAAAPERASAEAIVRELGGLPLALDQAGAYIEETGCGLLDYLHLYQQRRRELLGLRKSLTAEHPEPVTTTWSLSFQKIEEANRAGSALLRVCAFLAPDAMAEEIFTEGAPHLGSVLEPVATDPLKWNRTLEEVRRYSLLKRHAATKTLSMHRLVQAVLRDKMTLREQRQWAERAIRAVNAVFPDVELETWARCERYLPQAQVCAQLLEQYDLAFAEAADLLHQTGVYLQEHARYAEAERYYQQALQIYQKALPAEHRDTAATLHELGVVNLDRGRYAEAERYYQQALQIKQKMLPAEHPSTIITVKNYAYLLRQMGRENEAIALETRFKAK